MSIINTNILKSNSVQENRLTSFNNTIKSELDSNKRIDRFWSLVPHSIKSQVRYIIATQFNNDDLAYIKSVPLFTKLFTKRDTQVCNESIMGTDKKANRALKKEMKELELWAVQLLQLVGKNRAKILIPTQIKKYRSHLDEVDSFTNAHRLVNPAGKFFKLTSRENREKQKLAQLIRNSQYFSQVAQANKHTFLMCTITVPPIFHVRPKKGNNSFRGMKPSESMKHINHYWKLIRAKISKADLIFGEDVYGIEVLEFHEDSTVHIHFLIYFDPKNKALISNIIKSVELANNEQAKSKDERVNFHISHDDGHEGSSGHKYLYKYIVKYNGFINEETKDDDSVLLNTAARHYYSARAYNFFGMKKKQGLFNFVHSNILDYKKYFNSEIISMFEKSDIFTFYKTYESFFENEYYIDENDERKFLGVTVNLDCLNVADKKRQLKKTYLQKLSKNTILIEKKQYCIFETSSDFDNDKAVEGVKSIDMTALHNINVQSAYDIVLMKHENNEIEVKHFISEQKTIGVTVIVLDRVKHRAIPGDFFIRAFSNESLSNFVETKEEEKEKQQQSSKEEKIVTLIQPSSSKSNDNNEIQKKKALFVKNLVEKPEKQTKLLRFSLKK